VNLTLSIRLIVVLPTLLAVLFTFILFGFHLRVTSKILSLTLIMSRVEEKNNQESKGEGCQSQKSCGSCQDRGERKRGPVIEKPRSPGSIEDLEKYTESLYELVVACRSEKIGRIVQSDIVLDSQELDKVNQIAAIITAPGPKKRKILKDLKANGEDDVEEEDEEENTEEDPPGNQTGALEINAAANLKKIEDFEYDMFSDLVIGRGYDWIERSVYVLPGSYIVNVIGNNLPRVQNVVGNQGCNREFSAHLDGHVSRKNRMQRSFLRRDLRDDDPPC
jgi:hypothetical protein